MTMRITRRDRQGIHELLLEGRLDANWADHVAGSIQEGVRAGHHQIDLNFAGVNYLSSAGLRVLLGAYKELQAARGRLCIIHPTQAVLEVLELSGLAGMLVSERSPEVEVDSGGGATAEWDEGGVTFQMYELSPGSLELSVHGNPEAFVSGTLSDSEAVAVRCKKDVIALGLGAFAASNDDGTPRFGESFAVAGHAMTMPTDGSSLPDFQVAEGAFLPSLDFLYGLSARGVLGWLLRFEASNSPRGVVGLSQLTEVALRRARAKGCGMVVLAESAGVVGATLQRSPTLASGCSPLEFPGVRDWLTFTTERSQERGLVLGAGFVQEQPSAGTATHLRPIGPATRALGHFHAAVFPYRPVSKGRLELAEAVAGVFATESARTVMHLMADEREYEGVGETEFTRGACWVGPIRPAERGLED